MSAEEDWEDVLWPERFPRSARYDPEWIREHQMGPNPLWLAEWLCEAMALQIGMVSPGFAQDIGGALPEHLRPFWAQECWSWHPAEWWYRHWARTGLVEVECAGNMPEAWEVWRCHEKGEDAEVVEADQGRYMGLIRMVGRTVMPQGSHASV